MAPPRYILIETPQLSAPQPQPVLVAAAPKESLDNTLEYYLDARDLPEVASNAVVLVDAIA
mgnify:CR=1 FL=1